MDIFQNRKIVLTRLPVGHTHEDIDAIFGKIWKKYREQHILSPQQYMEMIIEALRNRKIPCEVIDVFCTPDYKDFMSPFISNASRAFKEELTQLQFIFEAFDFCEECTVPIKCEQCKWFPTGLRT